MILLRTRIERVLSREITINEFIVWYEIEFADLLKESGISDDPKMEFLGDYTDDFSYYEEDPNVRTEDPRFYGDAQFFELVKELRTQEEDILPSSGT